MNHSYQYLFQSISQNSRKPSVVVNASNEERIAVYGEMYSTFIEYDNISSNLINATIAMEDNRFYSHHGIDFRGILRALYVNITNLKKLPELEQYMLHKIYNLK